MMLNIETVCPFCGKVSNVVVDEFDYYDWQEGKLAQLAFPYLSPDERELLISGVCPDCWEKTFAISDEEEDEQEEETWNIF